MAAAPRDFLVMAPCVNVLLTYSLIYIRMK